MHHQVKIVNSPLPGCNKKYNVSTADSRLSRLCPRGPTVSFLGFNAICLQWKVRKNKRAIFAICSESSELAVAIAINLIKNFTGLLSWICYNTNSLIKCFLINLVFISCTNCIDNMQHVCTMVDILILFCGIYSWRFYYYLAVACCGYGCNKLQCLLSRLTTCIITVWKKN